MSSISPQTTVYPPSSARFVSIGPSAGSKSPGLTFGGAFLFVVGLAVFGSGFMGLRPPVFGMRLHPYLIPVIIITPFILYDMAKFPPRIGFSMLVFLVFYCLPIVSGGMPVSEAVKVSLAILTIVICAVSVHSRRDFIAGVLGLCTACLLMAFAGNLTDESASGVIDSGNKNSYSMYALPGILLAGFAILNFKDLSVFARSAMLISLCGSILSIFLTANRSGYLGVLLVGLMLLWKRKLKGAFYVLLIGGTVAFSLINVYSPEAFLRRMEQTFAGKAHDDARSSIQWACVEIILENPLFGVTMNQLPFEIGRHSDLLEYADPHNLYLHVAASNGLICLGILCYMAFETYFIGGAKGKQFKTSADSRFARQLLRMLLITFGIRGLFSREVLYNPSFCIAFGLCIGLVMLTTRSVRPPIRTFAVGATFGGMP